MRIYLAAGAPAHRRESLDAVADVRTAGDRTVGAPEIISDLAAEGRTLILLEGGPNLNSSFATADLIDEFCITRSPLLAPGGPGMIEGSEPQTGRALQLDRLLVADGMTFARYLRRAEPGDLATARASRAGLSPDRLGSGGRRDGGRTEGRRHEPGADDLSELEDAPRGGAEQ